MPCAFLFSRANEKQYDFGMGFYSQIGDWNTFFRFARSFRAQIGNSINIECSLEMPENKFSRRFRRSSYVYDLYVTIRFFFHSRYVTSTKASTFYDVITFILQSANYTIAPAECKCNRNTLKLKIQFRRFALSRQWRSIQLKLKCYSNARVEAM